VNTQLVYIGHDNAISVVLKIQGPEDDAPRLLTNDEMDAITEITLTVGNVLIESPKATMAGIFWRQSGYAQAEVRIMVGAVTGIAAGTDDAPLVVYDASNTHGVVWGTIPIRVLADPEGTT
jgi:hypothetical protein